MEESTKSTIVGALITTVIVMLVGMIIMMDREVRIMNEIGDACVRAGWERTGNPLPLRYTCQGYGEQREIEREIKVTYHIPKYEGRTVEERGNVEIIIEGRRNE